jgi:chemotaxis protein methyltransferase CheR
MQDSQFTMKELAVFCLYLSRDYGISFQPAKYSFVENRVWPLMRQHLFKTLNDLITASKRDIGIRLELLNVLTTNETWFFRHPKHFRILKESIIPMILRRKKQEKDNRISIWSAGCSIGAELYSILITLLDTIESPDEWNIQLLGSDISSEALNRARLGIYNSSELKHVEQTHLKRYFKNVGVESFQIKPEFSRFSRFELLNLLEPWPSRGFDIIFCRNTMIYFDISNKELVAKKFHNALNQNGYYFTSANETIHWGSGGEFKKLFIKGDYIYQKSVNNQNFTVFRFETPSDLLRAINLLTNNGVKFHLKKIDQTHYLAPKRSILMKTEETPKIEELFALSSIKVTHKEIVSQ